MAKQRKRTNKDVPAKGRLRDMADSLWAWAVKEDWAWCCAICGKTDRDNLNAHHLIGRTYQSVRFTLVNGISLCKYCHTMCPKLSPHLNGLVFREWLREHYENVATWVSDTVSEGKHKHFNGTTNWRYYCGVIQSFREYVDPLEFERICGVRFSRWLEEEWDG